MAHRWGEGNVTWSKQTKRINVHQNRPTKNTGSSILDWRGNYDRQKTIERKQTKSWLEKHKVGLKAHRERKRQQPIHNNFKY